ncbi:MAG: nitroreductase family protein [Planctomycetota bacterium]|jgi:FMN reductase [NAD(P)H]
MPNETLRILRERSSCRVYEDRPVEPEVLQTLLETAVRAPTGGNLQPYSIVKIEDEGKKKKLAELCGNQEYIARAPTDLLFCIDIRRLERWAALEAAPFTSRHSFRVFWIAFQDTIICAQNLCTAADASGLATVYIGTILEVVPEAREMLALPEGVFPVVLLCLGYPKTKAEVSNRLGLDVVFHDEAYRDLDDADLLEAYGRKYEGRHLAPEKEHLDRLVEAAETCHGPAFAERCRKTVEARGHINYAQLVYGLHYCADEMPRNNESFLRWMEEAGFGWFKPFEFAQPEDDADRAIG